MSLFKQYKKISSEINIFGLIYSCLKENFLKYENYEIKLDQQTEIP